MDKPGSSPVLFGDPFQIVGNQRRGFIPTDTHKFALTTLANAFHRVFQPIRVVDTTAHRAPSQTSPDLVITIFVISGVVGFHPFDFTIYDMHAQRAAATAVDGTSTPNDLLFFLLNGGGNCRASFKGQRDGSCRGR
ncbi:hypothetical protein D3C73_1179680 [compost metagenome]